MTDIINFAIMLIIIGLIVCGATCATLIAVWIWELIWRAKQ